MPSRPPPLSESWVSLVDNGVSILIGTSGADLMPESVRGVGVEVRAGGRELRVFVPAANGARALANLRDTGRIAVTLSRPTTHETVQLKGAVVAMRDAVDADRPLLDRYLASFSQELAYCGMPQNLTLRMANWPAVAVDLAIADVFQQTPGPGAGERLAPGRQDDP